MTDEQQLIDSDRASHRDEWHEGRPRRPYPPETAKYEADVNVRVIDWHFDGLSPDEHDALAMTDDEDQLLYEQIAEQLDNLASEF